MIQVTAEIGIKLYLDFGVYCKSCWEVIPAHEPRIVLHTYDPREIDICTTCITKTSEALQALPINGY